jgi:hypothetical protein
MAACYNKSMPKTADHADIVVSWKTKAVTINGKQITVTQFVQDMKANKDEPGENEDLMRECRGIDHFSWGDNSQNTYCFSLVCCFYLRVKWVMSYFFSRELEQAKQADLHLFYDNDQLDAGYLWSEEAFAKSFTGFMDKLGAVPVDEDNSVN